MSSGSIRRPPGDSSEQRRAQQWLLGAAGRALGVRLQRRRLSLGSGSYCEVGGCSDDPAVLCELWAHIGPVKSAQKHKVMADALKLLFARQMLCHDARCVLVFADEQAAACFQSGSWMAECLVTMGIETLVVDPPPELRISVLAAQERQHR